MNMFYELSYLSHKLSPADENHASDKTGFPEKLSPPSWVDGVIVAVILHRLVYPL